MDLKTNKKGNKYLLKDINASALLITVQSKNGQITNTGY